jgi:hypothetical protein
MPSYHMPSTGSARSVGPRRIRKQYTFADGTVVYSRSIQEAARLAGKLGEIPVLQPDAVPPVDADIKPVRRGTGGPGPGPGLGGGGGGGGGGPTVTPSTTATAGTPGSFDNDVPADLPALKRLGALGNTTAWTTGQYVALVDASSAYWDGAKWVAGKAP